MGIKCKESRLVINMWRSSDENDRIEGSVIITPYVTDAEILQRFQQWEVDNNIDIVHFDRFELRGRIGEVVSSATGLKTFKVVDLYWNFIRWVYDVATEQIAIWECEDAGLTDYILIEVKQ